MGSLRDRLARIREIRAISAAAAVSEMRAVPDTSAAGFPRWREAGYKVLRRTVTVPLTAPLALLPLTLPPTAPIIVPDLLRLAALPKPERLCFFDLETSGLSGGAGVVAFLAAFGRFIHDEAGSETLGKIEVTQFLLLDFPGESDFLEAVTGYIHHLSESCESPSPLLVTYNGKAFDSQILSTRCLMNGLRPPEFHNIDLLPASRRLWKKTLPTCSQAMIETGILGLSREGDVGGSFAPDIWFSFLNTGENTALLQICGHNLRDITGLAALFCALSRIAEKPLEAAPLFHADPEGLALLWRQNGKRLLEKEPRAPEPVRAEILRVETALLKKAVEANAPRAMLIYGKRLLKNGAYTEGRTLLARLAARDEPSLPMLRLLALRSLAIDAEWRLHDKAQALDAVNAALAIPAAAFLKNDLLHRKARLEMKEAHR
jgi:uncharacterized protein YprB with RNaseH-like and TPR domain